MGRRFMVGLCIERLCHDPASDRVGSVFESERDYKWTLSRVSGLSTQEESTVVLAFFRRDR